MNISKSLSGTLLIRIFSAVPTEVLSAINSYGISLCNVEFVDPITVQMVIESGAYKKILHLVEKRGEKIQVLRQTGAFWTWKKMLQRPLLLFFFFSFFVLVMFVPTRIFFVQVSGNVNIPAKLIIEEASSCGVRFGASRSQIRSEKVKNALIAKIPQLQWVGVNTSGCIATIEVQEKSVFDTDAEELGICSIVADRDGVIADLTVLQGTPVCKVGQVVKKGQTLVSGYTDCGLVIKATQAKAEVYAQTRHNITFITPIPSSVRGDIKEIKKKYSLKIGKKLINFFNDSGILDSTCVKMYEQKYLTLPGGFQLPLSLICEKYIAYNDNGVVSASDDYGWLKASGIAYVKEQMLAGRIITSEYESIICDDAYSLQSEFTCVEMIGKVKSEESLLTDGKDD